MRFRCVMVIALTFLFSIPLFGQNAKKQVAPEDPESNISQIFRNKQLPEKVRTAIKNGLVGVEVEHYVGMREGFGEIVTFTVDTSGGTGFVVDSHLVLTANHIVNRSPEPAQNGSDTVLY
ncbi:MAG: hypothetical protein Q8P49_01830, partial [Candidatus Liptonbacteria bacterium]|nr:hypothetical protein [Candidatus Liptonbacteria bacterium]